jgi:biotin carboxyl carrier protein
LASYKLRVNDQDYELEVEEHDSSYRVRFGEDEEWHELDLVRVGDSARYSLLLEHKPHDVFAVESPQGFHIVIGPRMFAITAPQAKRGRSAGGPEDIDAADGEWVLTSPMAGVVQDVRVQPGDEVEAGQVLLVIEAMKMQNDLHARRAGTVKAVYVTVADRVDQGAPLVVLL